MGIEVGGILGPLILIVDASQTLSRVRMLRDTFVGGIVQDLIKPPGNKYIEEYAESIAPNVLIFGQSQLSDDMAAIGLGAVGHKLGVALKRLGVSVIGLIRCLSKPGPAAQP